MWKRELPPCIRRNQSNGSIPILDVRCPLLFSLVHHLVSGMPRHSKLTCISRTIQQALSHRASSFQDGCGDLRKLIVLCYACFRTAQLPPKAEHTNTRKCATVYPANPLTSQAPPRDSRYTSGLQKKHKCCVGYERGGSITLQNQANSGGVKLRQHHPNQDASHFGWIASKFQPEISYLI